MSDLVVALDELEQSQSALEKIEREFENATSRVQQNDDIWSDDAVRDAMHSFATNWKDHREKLLAKMGDARKHTAKCIEAWQQSDASLANAVEIHQSGGAAPGHPAAN